jgi:hypothetical protein
MWDVNLQTLDIIWKDSILNICVFKVNDPYENYQVMGVPLTKKLWEV